MRPTRLTGGMLRRIIKEEIEKMSHLDEAGDFSWTGRFDRDDMSTWPGTPWEWVLSFSPDDPETWPMKGGKPDWYEIRSVLGSDIGKTAGMSVKDYMRAFDLWNEMHAAPSRAMPYRSSVQSTGAASGRYPDVSPGTVGGMTMGMAYPGRFK